MSLLLSHHAPSEFKGQALVIPSFTPVNSLTAITQIQMEETVTGKFCTISGMIAKKTGVNVSLPALQPSELSSL